MKRISIVSLTLLLIGPAAFAQARLDAVAPKDARTMAMGGSFVAMSSGYQSLYGNPASFADTKGEFTLLSTTAWAYLRPTQENIRTLTGLSELPESELPAALTPFITENGLGAGMSAGLGWVGKGLGLGLIGGGDVYLTGPNVLGAQGFLDATTAAVVGIGIPLQLGGLRLQVGGDIRPYIRMTGKVTGGQVISMAMGGGDFDPMTLPVNVGFGLALDLGAKLDLGKLLSVGLAVRDITPNMSYTKTTLGQVGEALQGGADAASKVQYGILPNLTAGVSLTPIPEGLRKLLDVTVTAELQDPVKVIAEKLSPFSLLHLGAEAELLGGLIAGRLGVNKGYISLGAGLDLLLMELNVAIFTEELGIRPGDKPRTGVSAEVALRF